MARLVHLIALLLSTAAFVVGDSPTRLVNLRIEGATDTIFEGPIRTHGRNVTTASGGTHLCDGTNDHANPTPGPTCTSALADAARLRHFSFDGTFDTEFDDFVITSIANSTQTTTQFWGLLLNFQFTPVGGCQQEVQTGQDILWAFDAINKVHFLRIVGPQVVRRHHAFNVTVTDGSTGFPVEGASVGSALTNADGVATITLSELGVTGLKATKDDSIRSNALDVFVE